MSHHDELEEYVAVSYELQDLRHESERLKRTNADLLAALEAVRGLAEVSQDYQVTQSELIAELRAALEEVTDELVYQRNLTTQPQAPLFDAENLPLVIDARAAIAKASS